MKVIQAHKNWIAAIVCGVMFVGAAVVVAQKPVPDTAATQNAKELSKAFREVSNHALPSIVSISTEGKPVQLANGFNFNFGDDDSPFGDVFRDRPELREFMKRQHPRQQNRQQVPRGKGSGFIIDKSGIIMTNNHVVRDADKVVVKLYDGREFVATDIKTDPRSDLAIIHIKGAKDLQALKLGDSDSTQIGDWVLAVGSPFGFDLTVTAGIISAKGRGPGINISEDYLQTDAAINPGNSGGPLLNLNGEVVGINTAISSQSGGYEGIGFAIPSNMARWISEQLMNKGTVSRAFLGVGIQPLNAELAKRFDTPVGQGAVVTTVMPNSTASEAGLQQGDVILELNGEKVGGTRELRLIAEKLKIGEKYSLTYMRDGKKNTVSVTTRAMPADVDKREREEDENDSKEPEHKTEKFDDLGLQTQELTADLAKRLGVEAKAGVVITAVQPDSPADKANLQAGQVVMKVDGTNVTSPEDFHKAIEKSSKEKGALLLVSGNNGPRFIVVQTH